MRFRDPPADREPEPCPAGRLGGEEGSKIRERSSGSIPGPLSATEISTLRRSGDDATRIRTVPPVSSSASAAFLSRFRKTCLIALGSTVTSGSSAS